ncbi:AMIN-like domain-containing (lipo)protein [Schaalia vaccimaxillae]|uniref:AMIN-like domain-containing (lipo)protein n=1 Tax=Schaalia vaccimaxillae TaxID=183916 RepID=UPI0003B52945|nr:hypothetical protein [Schaalia vaccimaxillae]
MSNRRARNLYAVMVPLVALGLAACSPNSDATSGTQSTASPSAQSQSTQPQSSDTSAQSAAAAAQDALTASAKAAEATMTTPINGDAWVTSLEPLEPTYSAPGLVFHDMRVGEHDGFYRVVIEFAGQGTPGLMQSWADKPLEQGRGRELPVQGPAWLDLVLTGTTMPVTDGLNALYYDGERQMQIGPLDVREDGTFEDTTHIVIGMDEAREFQIGFLESPARAVIDIRK